MEKDLKKARLLFLQATEHGGIDAYHEIMRDEERKDFIGKEQCIETVKEEFRAFLGFIKEYITIKDSIVDDSWIDEIHSFINTGKFVRANRSCMKA